MEFFRYHSLENVAVSLNFYSTKVKCVYSRFTARNHHEHLSPGWTIERGNDCHGDRFYLVELNGSKISRLL